MKTGESCSKKLTDIHVYKTYLYLMKSIQKSPIKRRSLIGVNFPSNYYIVNSYHKYVTPSSVMNVSDFYAEICYSLSEIGVSAEGNVVQVKVCFPIASFK